MHCLGVPEEFFMEAQHKAKEYCSIEYITGTLRKQAKKLFRKKAHEATEE